MSKYWEPPEAGVGGPEPLTPAPDDSPRTDAELVEGVKSAFFLDPDVSENNLQVSAKDGVVFLRGAVPSDENRRRAVELARGVRGVADVREEIEVRSR